MRKKTEKKSKEGSQPTRHIAQKATLELWVRSGGRCAHCNKFLLEEPFYERVINLGERAHIAGWTDSPGSPRGESDLPFAKRNKPENLILLCMGCHKIIDDPSMRKDFPEDRVLEIKREHEERIHHLTGMSHDRETTVLRVFGSVRGSIPEMARALAMRTVVDGAGRYARFPLAIDRYSIELDLSQIPEPEKLSDDSYWQIGKIRIDDIAKRISDAVHDKHIRHISVFALARIPLLIYLGYMLDDKVPVDLYQKHRGADEGWIWPDDDAKPVNFEIFQNRAGNIESVEAKLVLSLSGSINLSELPSDSVECPIYEIRPINETPNPNLFRSRRTLDAFARTFQGFLAQLEATNKSVKCIHTFPAVPITAAIAMGRVVMRHVHPALEIYDRINNNFQLALTINSN